MVKNLPARTGDLGLSREDPLEKEMATHSSILAWRDSMDREAWWVKVHWVAKSRTQLSNSTHTHKAFSFLICLFLWSLTIAPGGRREGEVKVLEARFASQGSQVSGKAKEHLLCCSCI